MDIEMTDEMPKVRKTFYSKVIKRTFDLLVSGLALLILSPVFLVITLLEWKFHGRPAIYKTKRPGKDGKIFTLYKFRSMTNERDSEGFLLPEEQRLTKFGIFLRKTSIDELPQLINIFKGDMAVIGPRPLLVEYLDLYTPRHAMRHAVRPGLVCITENKSNGPVTWRTQFESDVKYVESIGFITDVKMLFAVVKEVFKRADYRAMDTRPPFTGDNLDETRSKAEIGEVTHFGSLQ